LWELSALSVSRRLGHENIFDVAARAADFSSTLPVLTDAITDGKGDSSNRRGTTAGAVDVFLVVEWMVLWCWVSALMWGRVTDQKKTRLIDQPSTALIMALQR
jgi:hypothetical protein